MHRGSTQSSGEERRGIDIRRLLMATSIPLAAAGLQWLFWGIIQPYVWFLFYPAVFFSSRIGGLWGGLAATVISVVSVWWLFIPLQYSFTTEQPASTLAMGLFAVMGVFFSLTHERLRRTSQQLEMTVEELTVTRNSLVEQVRDRTADLTQAMDTLREGERRYRQLFEANPLPMWVYDLETLAFMAINDAAVAHYGYSRDEFLAMTIKDIRPAEDVPRLLENVASVGEGLDEAGIWRHRKKDGSLIEVEINSHTLLFNGHRAEMVLASDVTERRRIAAALAESEKLHRALFENSFDAILLTIPDGRILSANPAACRMFGRAEEEIRVLGRKGVVDLDDPRLAILLEERARTGKAFGELNLLRRDGSRFPAEVSSVVFRDSAGEPRTSMIIRDITERVRIEEKLRASEEFQRAIIAASPLAIISVVPNGCVQSWNAAAERIFGWKEEEVLGRELPIIPEHQQGNFRAIFERVLKGETFSAMGLTRQRKDGTEISVSLSTSPVRDHQGKVIAALGILADISEQIQAEVDRQKLIAELERRNAELERFTYTVSHDLKSPLVTILGFTGQLEQDLIDNAADHIKDDLTFIRGAAEQMRELLDNLLRLSRAGRAIGEPQPIDLTALAWQVIEQFGDRLAHARLQVVIPPDLPSVQGDPLRLREVLQNLLENAVKFTADQPDPTIEVGCTLGQGEILCHVRDNGIGIPAEYQEKVFDLFEKLDPHRDGTGVGLAIVRRIVEEHGGRVRAESAGQGRGSTFLFTLPI